MSPVPVLYQSCTLFPLTNDNIYQANQSVSFFLSTNKERVIIGAPSNITVSVVDDDRKLNSHDS